jgi:hypothetical protein
MNEERLQIECDATFYDDQGLVEVTFAKGREIAALYVREHVLVISFEEGGELKGAITCESPLQALSELRKFLGREDPPMRDDAL